MELAAILRALEDADRILDTARQESRFMCFRIKIDRVRAYLAKQAAEMLKGVEL